MRIFSLVSLWIALTCASLNAQSLVISQIYGGGGGTTAGPTFQRDYIEIFNRGATSASLSGLSVQYAASAGISWQVTALSGSLQPGQYFLIAESGNASNSGAPLPVAADVSGTIALSATAGKVALVASTAALSGACPTGTTILDFVGFGSAATCSEGSPTATLTNAQAAVRAGGGCTDAGNNATDFAATTPNPRNSGTTLSPCTGGLQITTSSLPNGTVNQAYSQTLTAAGNTGAVAFSLASGSSLPANLLLSAAGTISGIPLVAVTGATFTVQAQDASATVTKILQLTINDNGPVTCPVTNTISQVQGSGSRSPLVDSSGFSPNAVIVSGVVTGIRANGFFLQMPSPGDNNPATSDGIFVFASSVPGNAVVGNQICVTGRVQEYVPSADPSSQPATEIVLQGTPGIVAAGQPLPAPIVLTAADTSPGGGLDVLERFEGMRVQINTLTVVQGTGGSITEPSATVSSTGDFYGVLAGVARPVREAGIQLPDPLPGGAPANVPRFDTNPERIRIDSNGQIGSARLEVTAGATVSNIVGPLDYAFRTYSIAPDAATVPTVTGLASATPVPAALPGELTVASFNMERFFDTTANGFGEPVLTPTAFNGRVNKASLIIRNVLNLPDIIGVQEMENIGTLQTVANKVNADAVASGLPNPNYQGYLVPGNDIGGINVGFLVKATRVKVLDVTQFGKDTQFLQPDGQFAILNDRPPLVLRAVAAQAGATQSLPLTVIVNHLRSLNGVEDADGRVRAKRRAQAEFLASLIQSRQAAGEKIVSVGDYNAFAVSDGYVDVIGTVLGTPAPADQVVLASISLVSPPLTDLVNSLPTAQQYSYTFDGNAQTLDHILINSALQPQLSRFQIARNDADFPISYYADFTRPERLSDHDIPVVYLSLPAPSGNAAVNVSAQVQTTSTGLVFSRATRQYTGAVTITNTGSQSITGPLQLVLTNLTAGAVLVNASGTTSGNPYITVPDMVSLAPGQSAAVDLRFTSPTSPIAANFQVFAGTF